jgi:S1-C subfamily serine protease
MSDASSLDSHVISAVKKVSPSVVNISTVRFVRDFFQVQPVSGMGSGLVIDPRGYIVTNLHVIVRSDKNTITTVEGKKFSGTLVGTDSSSDIAVIKVDSDILPAAELGDSDKLNLGQFALAIGNPFGFILGGPSVTIGVVSALNRSIQVNEKVYENFIQTDAAINPGNSGGPLINITGNVIGINTAMIPYAQGIGFAIPINIVKRIAKDLISYGKVLRPWLGLVGLTINNEIISYYNLPVKTGVVVAKIIPGGPSHRAGVLEGDVIVKMNDVHLNNMSDLQKMIQNKKVGENIELEIIRNGLKGITVVPLGEVPQY